MPVIAGQRRPPAHAAGRAGGRLRSRAALVAHLARMLPWGPLLAGCLTGIGMAVLLLAFAGPAETPAALCTGLRCSFVPVVAGLAFLLPDPNRQLTGSLPFRAWRVAALRLVLALPVACAGCLVQLLVAAHALTLDLHAAGQPPARLPWPGLTTELAAWCLVALALSAAFGRTRWYHVAGIAAAVSTLAAPGVAAVLPLHLLPAAISGMSAAQRRQWAVAWAMWAAAGVLAAAGAAWAAGDPWRRLRPRPAVRYG